MLHPPIYKNQMNMKNLRKIFYRVELKKMKTIIQMPKKRALNQKGTLWVKKEEKEKVGIKQ